VPYARPQPLDVPKPNVPSLCALKLDVPKKDCPMIPMCEKP
jgi:hypothetical protein